MRKWINLLLESFEDKALPMEEPIVLYRSVSIPELISVAFRGAVTGGGNKFNIGDDRACVMFGDELNSDLYWQGEDHSRYPIHSLRNDTIHSKFKELKNDIEDESRLTINLLRSVASKLKLAISDEIYDGLERADRTSIIKAMEFARFDQRAKASLDELRSLAGKRSKLQDLYNAKYTEANKSFHAVMRRWPYSSAVLVTKPIVGGFVFTGKETFYGEREYGFYPSQVTTNDIDHVILVKDKRPVKTIDTDDILSVLKSAGIDINPYLQ